jgi:putative solute:sodium symporter small subunit
MTDNDSHSSTADATDEAPLEPDGGAVAGTTQTDQDVDYLDSEVNLLDPSTPFMRDHLRIIWTGFVAWAVIVFGPVTLTAIAPDAMTTQLPVLGFPLHYFLVATGAPGGALVLSYWYARKRDALDKKYGVVHETTESAPEGAAATDGG